MTFYVHAKVVSGVRTPRCELIWKYTRRQLMINPYFPFHALGFRCNPFRAVTDDEWVDIAILPEPVAEIAAKGFVNLQVLGEKGYGITTTLLAQAAQFKREG